MGPHSNIAELFKSNELNNNPDEIVILGGDFENCELNVASDPEATRFVIDYALENGIKLTFIPRFV